MKKYINYILLVSLLLLFVSCSTKEWSVGYSNTCFNKDNKIIYIKDQSYFHWDLLRFLDAAEVYESYLYICKMDLYGNEEVIRKIPSGAYSMQISEGNGRLCLQTGNYSAYTYIDGKFTEVLSEDRVIHAMISYNQRGRGMTL